MFVVDDIKTTELGPKYDSDSFVVDDQVQRETLNQTTQLSHEYLFYILNMPQTREAVPLASSG